MTDLKMLFMRQENLQKNGAKPVNGHTVPIERDHGDRLFNGHFQVGIGIYDGLSALLAEKWKFDFVWVSSFCCSAAAGLPDAGIIGPEDILNVVRCVGRSIDLPIVTDLDSGYGDAVKVFHVVEAMARAGVAALCIEDNPTSKRCSLYEGYDRVLVSPEEHIARLRAAKVAIQQARSSCRIIARTEALVAGMGVKEALRRATAYADAGADAVFIQSLDATGNEVLTFGRKWQRRTPIFIAPTRLPQITKKDFANAGISHPIFANQGSRAAHAAMDRTFGALAQGESAAAAGSEISSVTTIASLVGAQKVVDLEASLAGAFGKLAPLEKKLRTNAPSRSLRKLGSRVSNLAIKA